ncbi:hypothetical protein VTN49DRAFT_6694 [Thermomyces lanuginosus]|uniref:uncharacterized protein n=1 Tax=Thermomyces lanuginosus TaxID=5541 RepID=UPI003743A896
MQIKCHFQHLSTTPRYQQCHKHASNPSKNENKSSKTTITLLRPQVDPTPTIPVRQDIEKESKRVTHIMSTSSRPRYAVTLSHIRHPTFLI